MPKTETLPGVTGKGADRPVIKELDKLISTYETKKNARVKESPGEVAAKKELFSGLMAHAESLPKNEKGERYYRYEIADGEFKDFTLSEVLRIKKVENDNEE